MFCTVVENFPVNLPNIRVLKTEHLGSFLPNMVGLTFCSNIVKYVIPYLKIVI